MTLQITNAPSRSMRTPASEPRRLAVAAGDVVVASDGPVGRVEHVIRSEDGLPRHLVVGAGLILRRHPVISCELVTTVDSSHHTVHVRGDRKTLRHLEETLPLVL